MTQDIMKTIAFMNTNPLSKMLSLSANENTLSNTASRFLNTDFSNRYYSEANSGDFSDYPYFVANSYPEIDNFVELARKAMRKMSGAEYVNLFPLSGIHAMLMTIIALTRPGDVVMSLPSDEIGHFATRDVVESLGRKSQMIPMANGVIDIDRLRQINNESKISLIYLDSMSCLDTLPVSDIRKSIRAETLIAFDASHSLGLILGHQAPNPLLYGADVICSNTHKTFPGPHRGIILAKTKELGNKIESQVAGKLYSSTHFGTLIPMAITIFEMYKFGEEYTKQICINAQEFGINLVKSGVKVAYSNDKQNYTNNHQLHIPFDSRVDALQALQRLRNNNIIAHICHNNSLGYFIRLGVQEVTRRGMIKDDMHPLATVVAAALKGEDVVSDVAQIVDSHQNVKYSYDNQF
jgi:glycine/serine hydroxymethyltransferase